MREGTKAWLGLLAGAGAGLLYLQLSRETPPAPPATAPSAPAPARSAAPPFPAASVRAAAPPRVPATAAEVEAARKRLGELVRAPAGDPASPWALAHGMVAFGPEFRARDGRLALEVIARHAARGAGGRLGFPTRAEGAPVEPHPRLLVKTLLEAGVPLDRRLTVADGSQVSLRDLARDGLADIPLPTTDAGWHHAAWTLSALAELEARAPGARTATPTLEAWAEAALRRLEQDHAALGAGTAEASLAFAEGSPLRAQRERKEGIFGHSCGGFHLVQAVLVSLGPDPERRRRAQRQLGVLLFRYEAERESLAGLRAAHPEHALVLDVQALKFLGHLLETVGLARTLGLYDASTEGGRRLEALLHDAAGDLTRLIAQLDASGVYGRLDALRPEREQVYLDLVGDGCHALRGLARVPGQSSGK